MSITDKIYRNFKASNATYVSFRALFTEINVGLLSSQIWYPITAFLCESTGYDYIQISYKEGGNTYSTSWNGRLRNLQQGIIIY